MKMRTSHAAFFLALSVAAAPAFAATGAAKISGTAEGSAVAGTLKVADDGKGGLTISGDISGLTPGLHGFHIHEFGDCSDSGKAAGSHYNPANHPHGNVLKDGQAHAHAGDMGNLEADSQGVAHVNVDVPGLMLTGGKVSAAGRALVVHEKADDFGQPVGNAGGRIGCGPIILTSGQ
jgi:Cu-Zn family superoxide dismutase